ncbi:MAG: hypothetical protein ACRDEA_17825 [Microcystaceae cyanobacterium]
MKKCSEKSKKSTEITALPGRKYSLLRVSAATRSQVDLRQKELGVKTQDELIRMLLEATAAKSLLNPVPRGIESFLSKLEPSLEKDLRKEIAQSGEEPEQFMEKVLEKEVKFRAGVRGRHEGKDFSQMPLSQLKRTRHGEASNEKLKRAFQALKHYNSAIATEKLQRWYINANSLHQLVGGRFGTVTPWVEAHRDEITSHNSAYELTEADNRKPIKIEQVVTVPEFPTG